METGTILVGRYLIERHLSKGGQGNVYLAQDLRLSNRLCAVKRVQATLDLTDTKAQVAQNLFQSEAAMLAQLKHANLPIIYDFFTEADASYLVMEFVPGKTLQSILEQHPKGLPEAQVVEWANQLVTVLQYLHNQNPPIVFRDLKPANVMLDKDDKIKLIDFGIARHFKTENSRDTVVAGTPGYLSPEGYGREQTDTRTDVYSLGVLLIVLLTGINPSSYGFSIPNPRKIRSDISVGLDHTLARAIALKKEDRYQAMADFAQALQNRVIIEERTVVGFMPNPDLTTTILDRPAPVVVPAVIPAPEGEKPKAELPVWAVALLAMLGTIFVGGLGLLGGTWLLGSQLNNTAPYTPVASERNMLKETESAPLLVDLGQEKTASPLLLPTYTAQPTYTALPTYTAVKLPTAVPTQPSVLTTVQMDVIRDGFVVFDTTSNTGQQLFIANADGSNLRQLTDSSGVKEEAAVSANNEWIAYGVNNNGAYDEIWVIQPDGTDEQRLPIQAPNPRLPAWNPATNQLAFESGGQIWQFDFNSADEYQLTKGLQHRNASWSQDGRYLITMVLVGDVWQIAVLDTKIQQEQIITNESSYNHRFPEISPDGQWIVYNTSTLKQNAPMHIGIVRINGRDHQILTTTGANGRPNWSPDGQKIIFNTDRSGAWEVFVMDADGSNQKRLVKTNGNAQRADWGMR